MMKFSLKKIAQIIEPVVVNQEVNLNSEITITDISTDTRSLKPGELFLALRGENFDGHTFLDIAITQGASALIIDQDQSTTPSKAIPQFLVTDTLEAYQKIAKWWREQLEIPVIAITGSVGKTTTKELMAAVLNTQGKVLKTAANYNNEIGVPKTLLQIQSEHDYAVIEMAMRAPGEIALLTQITRPTIGVITNVGSAHIGRLGSLQAIANAKCELLKEMPPDSIAILNHDNWRLMETAPKFWQGKVLTYGLEGGDLKGEIIDENIIQVDGYKLPLPLPGRHNAINYLAALAVAKVLGIDFNNLTNGLDINMPKGRAKRYQLTNDIEILDETYNAGLESMLAALDLLKQTPGKRHIAVLGTMKELGDCGADFHFQVGQKVKELNLDHLLVMVDEPVTNAIAQGSHGIVTECFTTHEAIINRVMALIKPGDRILFKASNSVGLNKVVEAIAKQLK